MVRQLSKFLELISLVAFRSPSRSMHCGSYTTWSVRTCTRHSVGRSPLRSSRRLPWRSGFQLLAETGRPRRPNVRRSCIPVAYVTVAGERLGYTCVRRVRLRPSLSWTFPPQNYRGAASAAFFCARSRGCRFTASIRFLAAATPPGGMSSGFSNAITPR